MSHTSAKPCEAIPHHSERSNYCQDDTKATGTPGQPVRGNASRNSCDLISAASPDADKFRIDALRRGLNDVGLTEGQSFVFEYLWVGGQYDRFPALLADLVRRRVNVIVSLGGTPGALAAKAATKTIPIVFQVGIDPVAAGLVDSLSRPDIVRGPNLTHLGGPAIYSAVMQYDVLGCDPLGPEDKAHEAAGISQRSGCQCGFVADQ